MNADTLSQTLPHRLLEPGLRQLNGIIATDPFTTQALRRLAGKPGRNVRIQIFPGNRVYMLRLEEDGPLLRLLSEPASGNADLCLEGSLPALVTLMFASDRSAALAASDVRVTGDTLLLQHLQEIGQDFEPDAGALLAPWIGNPLAGLVQAALFGAQTSIQEKLPDLRRRTSEALTGELRLLPTRRLFERFSEEVFDLQARVERLTAQLDRLQT